jgi:hypothetical protein
MIDFLKGWLAVEDENSRDTSGYTLLPVLAEWCVYNNGDPGDPPAAVITIDNDRLMAGGERSICLT